MKSEEEKETDRRRQTETERERERACFYSLAFKLEVITDFIRLTMSNTAACIVPAGDTPAASEQKENMEFFLALHHDLKGTK